jgi:hypothetical protein
LRLDAVEQDAFGHGSVAGGRGVTVTQPALYGERAHAGQALYSIGVAVHVGIADASEEYRMSVRLAWLAIPFTIALLVSGPAMAAAHNSSAEAHAAEARALRAQIDHMDSDLQALESQLYRLQSDHTDDPARAGKESALRAQIHRMDHDQELLEDRLRELEHEDPAIAAESRKAADDTSTTDHYATPATPPPAPAPIQMAPPPPPPPPAPPVLGPTLRQAADPAPYEKAAGGYVGAFRYNSYRWVPVGTRQLAVYNTYDEAYLLDFANDCPGLLTADHIKVENFSTKVVMGRDAIIADGQRCPITGIRELNTSRLPR